LGLARVPPARVVEAVVEEGVVEAEGVVGAVQRRLAQRLAELQGVGLPMAVESSEGAA
jgi:hypothetical protein